MWLFAVPDKEKTQKIFDANNFTLTLIGFFNR